MEEKIFLIIVGILVLLAISDLIVGVSNDAVNFLNSAIGSKAAPLRVILIVAALGIIAGATFSNGMMEVARKSIFHPDAFTFKEIMIIFLAVMLTDIILLDLFNTFGLPTSTTVSIVFELLGAAVGLAIIKITSSQGDFSEMVNYINSAKALAIIFGILVSVVIAFSVGMVIQWVSRLLLTFDYGHSLRFFGGIFGGIAITSITYFILIKGLKGSVYADQIVSNLSLNEFAEFLSKQNFDGFKSLIKALGTFGKDTELANWAAVLKDFDKNSFTTGISNFSAWASNQSDSIMIPLTLTHWVKYNILKILLGSFLVSGAIIQLLYALFRINILKIIVIIGTFALAMAFAGNDLVNFIGVPLAGISSYTTFINTPGAIADSFTMEALKNPVQTNIFYLLIAGLIMVITLWISRKAKSVVKTTLNLSDQDVVTERFESSALARSIVRQSVKIGKAIDYILPNGLKKTIEKRFDSTVFRKTAKKETGLSFDLVRASVNLVVASILIAIGTSLKLPLSTTYVTFMVAMGTSLADGAWDRESAVYRISGVITVIGGWFFTAVSAFTVSIVIAFILIKLWPWGIFVVLLIALFLVYRTHLMHSKRTKKDEENSKSESVLINDGDSMFQTCRSNVISLLIACSKAYNDNVSALVQEKRKKLKSVLKDVKELNETSKQLKKHIPIVFRDLQEEAFESGQHYVEVIEFLREAMHSLYYISQPTYKHIDNNHKPLTEYQVTSLIELSKEIQRYLEGIIKSINKGVFNDSGVHIEEANKIFEEISKIHKKQLKLFKKELGSTRTNILFLDYLNETKNLILNLNNMYKAIRDFSEQNKLIKLNL